MRREILFCELGAFIEKPAASEIVGTWTANATAATKVTLRSFIMPPVTRRGAASFRDPSAPAKQRAARFATCTATDTAAMKAVVWYGVGKITVDNVADPKIRDPYDVIVRLTSSAICGTDLHMIRGTMPGMKAGTILGHEGVGIVEAVGKSVRNFDVGDRVVVPSTISCGACPPCRAGFTPQCDNANPTAQAPAPPSSAVPPRRVPSTGCRPNTCACRSVTRRS